MFYGRRIFKSTQQQFEESRFLRKYIINRAFQYKYLLYTATAIAGGVMVFLIPAYFFISQNYQVFSQIAFDSHPHLISHLDREISWLKGFLILSFITILVSCSWLVIRMTKNLISPLIEIEKHMRLLMLGHWDIPDYQMHADNEYRDLSMTYEYFYRALRANTEVELQLLEKMNIDPHNREAYAAWKKLVSIHRSRLGQQSIHSISENVAPTDEVVPLRRVS
jgi:hypothetical protein